MSSFSAIVLGFIVILVGYLVKSYIEQIIRNAQLPPGPKPWPLIGNLNLFSAANLHPTLSKIGKEYGGIFRLQTGWRSSVWITSYNIFREAVIQHSWTFADRPHDLRVGLSEPNDYPGIAASGIEEDNKEIRRFTMVGLRNFGFGKNTMQEMILQHCDLLVQEMRRKDGAPFKPRPLLANSAANVISAVLLGETFSPDDAEFEKLSNMLTTAVKMFLNVQLELSFPFMKFVPRKSRALSTNAFKEGKDFLRRIVAKHQRNHVEGQANDFVDLWLDQEKKEPETFAAKRLPSALMDMFLGGYESTATAFEWMFAMLIHHPEAQEKIHDELERELGRGNPVLLEHRPQLIFTEAFILETFRMFPIIPFAAPHMAAEDSTLAGHKIPKGSRIMLHIWSIHYDPELWEDPEQFRPERFIKDGRIVQPEFFVPFSAGRRSCIGEQFARKELFLFFANILQNFIIRGAPDAEPPSLEVIQSIVIYPKPFDIVALPR